MTLDEAIAWRESKLTDAQKKATAFDTIWGRTFLHGVWIRQLHEELISRTQSPTPKEI